MPNIKRQGYKDLFARLDDSFPNDAIEKEALTPLSKQTAECHDFVRTLLFSSYFSNCIVLTRVKADDENAAFDIFDALNTTGEPLTAIETLKPRIIAYEKKNKGFAGSESENDIKRIEEFVDKYPRTSKQSETKHLIVSFALLLDGTKLPQNLASQRNFLRTKYDKATATSKKRAERFVSSLADMAEFRYYYWTVKGIEELGRFHSTETVDQTQLLISFIKDMKTELALPILARYWSSDFKQRKQGDSDFLDVLKAVTAFLVLRRAASGSTSGIDSDFRSIMMPKNHTGSDKKFGLCIGVDQENKLPEVKEIKAAFKNMLSAGKYNITEKTSWINQVVDNPLYRQSKELVRFLIFVAAHQGIASKTVPGGWDRLVKSDDHTSNFLNYKTWRSELYKTVEHVAPDNGRNWDEEIYKNNILRHSIGNLCLLPKKENAAIGNSDWSKKKAFYLALTEKDPDRIEKANAALGIKFPKSTIELLKGGKHRLSLLDPLRDVDEWSKEVIDMRGKNIADLTWDYLWPWLG